MFCTNCGKQMPEGSRFCVNCGTRETAVRQPAQETPQHQPVQQPVRSYPVQKKQTPGGKIAVIVIAAVVAIACVGGGIYVGIHQRQMYQQELQMAQDQAAQAQAVAEQAQKDAEAAKAEKDQAEADAVRAQQDAAQAQQAAEQAKSEAAAAQTAAIIAAIRAAQNGDTVTYDGYIFPSDRVYITEADMYYWDKTMTLLARNEIFARHGYVFTTDYIQNYFATQSWYYPDPSYKGTGLSKVEQANVETILAYEKKKGWQ